MLISPPHSQRSANYCGTPPAAWLCELSFIGTQLLHLSLSHCWWPPSHRGGKLSICDSNCMAQRAGDICYVALLLYVFPRQECNFIFSADIKPFNKWIPFPCWHEMSSLSYNKFPWIDGWGSLGWALCCITDLLHEYHILSFFFL